MKPIRRAVAVTATAGMAALVTVTATACGGATTTTGTTTNSLERKSPVAVRQDAARALLAARTVHVVGVGPVFRVDERVQDGSSTGTFAVAGTQVEFTIIGNAGYIKTDQAGLQASGFPPSVQRHDAGRWLKVPVRDFTGSFTLAGLAAQLTKPYGQLEPKVGQATLNGRKVVAVSWRNGSKLYVANRGPAYPLRGDFTGQNAGRIDFTEYGAALHITAPSNVIDLSNAR